MQRGGNWLILDRDYRIVAAQTTRGDAETHVGQILWDVFPGAKSLYGVDYAEAWASGPVETRCFHRGALVHVTAKPMPALLVSYEIVAELETVTLTALSQSLDRLERLAAQATRESGRPLRPGLRMIPGRPPPG